MLMSFDAVRRRKPRQGADELISVSLSFISEVQEENGCSVH